jgi:hypothetical protein
MPAGSFTADSTTTRERARPKAEVRAGDIADLLGA